MDRRQSAVRQVFVAFGAQIYADDEVTVLSHSMQTATLGINAGAPNSLVVAAFVHDIGQLLHTEDDNPASRGFDMRHEELGAQFLLTHGFPPSVVLPVRLHVLAKRYLCAIEPDYAVSLSRGSQMSLTLQGGPLSVAERAAFESNVYFSEALQLRSWDDLAKDLTWNAGQLPLFIDRIGRLPR